MSSPSNTQTRLAPNDREDKWTSPHPHRGSQGSIVNVRSNSVSSATSTASAASAAPALGGGIWSPPAAPGPRLGASYSFGGLTDSEAFRTGGIAWGSAEQRSYSDSGRRASSASSSTASLNSGTPDSLLASLAPPPQPKNNFTGPAISLLDQFASLADATRRAESRRGPSLWSSTPAPSSCGATSATPRGSTQSGSPAMGLATTGSQVSPVRPSVPVIPVATASAVSAAPPASPTAMPPSPQPRSPTVPVPARGLVTPPPNGSQAQPSKKPVRRRRQRAESPILEDLRARNGGPVTIASILGNVVDVSTDQHGSRFIQENLGAAPANVRAEFFRESCQHLLPLTMDVFGNYVVQQLFELGTQSQRTEMVNVLRGHVLALSLQMYGCRVIQVALRYAGEQNQIVLVDELKGAVTRCIKDHNGNHVVQKAVEYVDPEHVHFVYAALLERTTEFATHMYGCRVVQRVLEHADAPTRRLLLQDLRSELDRLVMDQYGNYVVQHIVDNGPPEDRQWVLDRLLPQAVPLSSHKYASNVVEKCFVRGSPRQRSQLVGRVLATQPGPSGAPYVVGMIRDQYANYVIQKVLATAADVDYARLVAAIRPHLPELKRTSFGKHLAAVERLMVR